MKVFVLKGRKLFTIILAFFVIAATVFAILVSRPDVLSAFSAAKDFPYTQWITLKKRLLSPLTAQGGQVCKDTAEIYKMTCYTII
jgi:hypothetical protein